MPVLRAAPIQGRYRRNSHETLIVALDNHPISRVISYLALSIDSQAELGHQRLPKLYRIGEHLAKASALDSGVASNPISIMSRWYSGVNKSARVVLLRRSGGSEQAIATGSVIFPKELGAPRSDC